VTPVTKLLIFVFVLPPAKNIKVDISSTMCRILFTPGFSLFPLNEETSYFPSVTDGRG